MEGGTLRRILKQAKLWHANIADEVTFPKPPPTIGRSLTPTEKSDLLEVAGRRPEWETAYFAAIISLNTTMRGGEVRGLRWADIDLLTDTLTIGESKTEAGVRVIPLTPDALEVFVKLRERAETFGPVEPSHFVFASFKRVACFNGHEIIGHRVLTFDPTRPIGSWKRAWRKLTIKAGLAGLRFHDLRHHAITELLTNPNVSVQTTKSIAGHVSKRMTDRYSHIQLEDKRRALGSTFRRGNVINSDIKSDQEEPLSSQVVDSNGVRLES